ncbi:MAG: hypothetical protein ACJ79G_23145 [Myxococcales bacterium]
MAATSVIFIQWQLPARGREKNAQETFGEAIALYGRLQREGKIESFEPVLLDAHGDDLTGFILVRGDPEKLDAVIHSGEYQSLNMRAMYNVDGFGAVRGVIGEELARRMGYWQKNFL